MAEYAEQIYMFVAGAHQIHQRIPGVRGHPPGLRPESTNHKSSTHALGRVRRADFIARADSCADIHHGKKEFCAERIRCRVHYNRCPLSKVLDARDCLPIDMQVITCILFRARHMNDRVFRALADPSRRLLLDRLYASNGQTLSELGERLDMTRQAVTQHLKALEAANLVTTVWRGREKLHYLNPVPLQQIYERWIRKFETPRLSALHKLKKRLEGV
jgi:DNA-binding transcriptional ArsR family regulator